MYLIVALISLERFQLFPRSEKNPEDIDTEAEDHLYDVLRYRVTNKKHTVETVSIF